MGLGPVANAGENLDQCLTERREGVLDGDGDGCVGVTGDQAVALEAAQRLRQQLLGDAVEASAKLAEPVRTLRQDADDQRGPPVADAVQCGSPRTARVVDIE
jgi:hypothetical protein